MQMMILGLPLKQTKLLQVKQNQSYPWWNRLIVSFSGCDSRSIFKWMIWMEPNGSSTGSFRRRLGDGGGREGAAAVKLELGWLGLSKKRHYSTMAMAAQWISSVLLFAGGAARGVAARSARQLARWCRSSISRPSPWRYGMEVGRCDLWELKFRLRLCPWMPLVFPTVMTLVSHMFPAIGMTVKKVCYLGAGSFGSDVQSDVPCTHGPPWLSDSYAGQPRLKHVLAVSLCLEWQAPSAGSGAPPIGAHELAADKRGNVYDYDIYAILLPLKNQHIVNPIARQSLHILTGCESFGSTCAWLVAQSHLVASPENGFSPGAARKLPQLRHSQEELPWRMSSKKSRHQDLASLTGRFSETSKANGCWRNHPRCCNMYLVPETSIYIHLYMFFSQVKRIPNLLFLEKMGCFTMFQPFFSSGSIRASRKTHVGPSRSNLGGQDPSIGSWDSIEVTTASSWREGYQTGTDSEAWYLRWFSCVLVSFWVCFCWISCKICQSLELVIRLQVVTWGDRSPVRRRKCISWLLAAGESTNDAHGACQGQGISSFSRWGWSANRSQPPKHREEGLNKVIFCWFKKRFPIKKHGFYWSVATGIFLAAKVLQCQDEVERVGILAAPLGMEARHSISTSRCAELQKSLAVAKALGSLQEICTFQVFLPLTYGLFWFIGMYG